MADREVALGFGILRIGRSDGFVCDKSQIIGFERLTQLSHIGQDLPHFRGCHRLLPFRPGGLLPSLGGIQCAGEIAGLLAQARQFNAGPEIARLQAKGGLVGRQRPCNVDAVGQCAQPPPALRRLRRALFGVVLEDVKGLIHPPGAQSLSGAVGGLAWVRNNVGGGAVGFKSGFGGWLGLLPQGRELRFNLLKFALLLGGEGFDIAHPRGIGFGSDLAERFFRFREGLARKAPADCNLADRLHASTDGVEHEQDSRERSH